jgi:paraquat-inducible protein B
MKTRIRKNVQKLKTGWYLWIFPLIALVISAWVFYDYYRDRGPRLQILFDDASGIQAEKTKVRFRGVTIGAVKDVHLSKDQNDVVAEVLLRKDAADFAIEGSKFSLVTPKVTFQGISGLETLF